MWHASVKALHHESYLQLCVKVRDSRHHGVAAAEHESSCEVILVNASQPELQILAALCRRDLHVVPVHS